MSTGRVCRFYQCPDPHANRQTLAVRYNSADVKHIQTRLAFDLLPCPLLVLALCTISNAQLPATAHGSSIYEEGGISLAAEGSQAQSYVIDHESRNHQPTGFVIGTVLDQTGAISVGADVRLSWDGEGSAREMRSGKNGQFSFADVAPGPFRLTVTAPGFATHEFTAALHPGETFLVPAITLSIKAAVTEVRVQDRPLTTSQLADIQLGEQTRQRVFGLFPNFYVTYKGNVVPLNTSQKFKLAWKTTSDPFTFVGVAALAGLEQATNAFEGYGQGAEGYFKRFGASYTDAVSATYIGSAVLPSVLKQDPRYFYKGKGNVGSRLLYALGSPFFCKGDNMRWQPNYSNVGGTFAAAGISYLYYPQSDRNGAGLFLQNSMIRLSEMSFEGVLQEFVIRRLTPRLNKRASDER